MTHLDRLIPPLPLIPPMRLINPMRLILSIRLTLVIALMTWVCQSAAAQAPAQTAAIWQSQSTGTALAVRIHPPIPAGAAPVDAGAARPMQTVVYLANLRVPRIASVADEALIAEHRAVGRLVIEIDYAGHDASTAGGLVADLLKIRRDLSAGAFFADWPIDPARLFILPSGYRLLTDVRFATDGARTLAMDVLYPADPLSDARPVKVPALIEFSCDNANRMGNGSLVFCRDTLVESAALAGFVSAMADHPVAPPYKGIDDPMPEALHRARAAIDTLEGIALNVNHNGRIGAIGFSRGGPFAAMLAAQGHVGAALVHGNRYDYSSLIEGDPMLARFEKAWGPYADNRERWLIHGAVHHLTDSASPMYLNTSDAESAEYRDGLADLAEALKARSVEHVYRVDVDGRGHRVTTDPQTLAEIFAFFARHLTPATSPSR